MGDVWVVGCVGVATALASSSPPHPATVAANAASTTSSAKLRERQQGHPPRHFMQWTSSTGLPSISLVTQSTSFSPFTFSV
jgi:hypothetical protein